MSSLSPQISSFSNPFSISSDSFDISLDLNQSIPNIMNSGNDILMNDPNAFVSKSALFYPSAETIMGEKKVGGEPLKQYFSALANGSDGTNVLPLPDKKITYGIYNVAYRGNNCSTPETKDLQVPELSNGVTVTTTPPSSTFIQQPLTREYCNPQRTNVNNAFPPSPVSPKFRTMVNSPYSYIDSNVTLTPGSRNEVSTPISSLTYNGSILSNGSIVDDEACNQSNYENNSSKNTTYYYNTNPQMNHTQTNFFSNINNQRNMNMNPQQQQTTTTTISSQSYQPQNLYYINVNGQWKLQNPHENSCFYARRKQELKQLNSPVPIQKVKVETSQIPTLISSTNSQSSPLFNQVMIPQESNNSKDVKLSFQYPTNYQVQVSLQQPQTNTQASTINSVGVTDINYGQNNNANACIPQVIVNSNTSVQQIIVQPATQQLIYQPNTTATTSLVNNNNLNMNGFVIQQQQQPVEPVQRVIVQSQVPTVTVSNSTPISTVPLATPSQTPLQLPSQIQCQTNSPNTIQQVVVQLQSIQNSNSGSSSNSQVITNVSPIQTTNQQTIMIPSNPGLASPITPISIKQEYGTSVKMENSSSKTVINETKIKEESKVITPVSSPLMEDSAEKNIITINLANYKPINSHLDNYKNNKPAVLKFIPVKTKNSSVSKRKLDGSKIMKNSASVYKCDVCQKEFLKYYQMKSHLRTHMTEKPFKCEYCTRAFCRKHDLARHIRIHTGDTPYICSNCFKGFARSDACTRHVRQNLCKRNIINYNPETKDVKVAI